MYNMEMIEQAAAVLKQVAQPEKIILFGSYGRAEAQRDSDLDILVVEREVKDRVAEMARLNRALGFLRLPIDLLLVSQEKFDYWSDTPGNVYYRAKREGKVIYEAS